MSRYVPEERDENPPLLRPLASPLSDSAHHILHSFNDDFSAVDGCHDSVQNGRQGLQDTAEALQRSGNMGEVDAIQESHDANDALGGGVEPIENGVGAPEAVAENLEDVGHGRHGFVDAVRPN